METGHGIPMYPEQCDFRQAPLFIGLYLFPHKMRSDQMGISEALASFDRLDFSFLGKWEPVSVKRCWKSFSWGNFPKREQTTVGLAEGRSCQEPLPVFWSTLVPIVISSM